MRKLKNVKKKKKLENDLADTEKFNNIRKKKNKL